MVEVKKEKTNISDIPQNNSFRKKDTPESNLEK